MDTGLARIPARSRRQAMDWSLVLASQGIEVTIATSEEDGAWGLLLPEADHAAALESIRQYRRENRGWHWHRTLSRGGVLFDWSSLAWVLLIGVFFFLQGRGNFLSAGILDSASLSRGQWWRLFTAIWLHADAGHFASNAVIGFLLLGLVMPVYGTGTGLLASYLAGAGGNLASWLLAASPHRSLGASGMVMGSLGLLAVQSCAEWRRTRHTSKPILLGLFAGVMLFVLMGLSPGTDVLAHSGGFLSGVLLGIPLSPVSGSDQKPWVNPIVGLLFGVLVVVPWWLALHHTVQIVRIDFGLSPYNLWFTFGSSRSA